MGKQRVEHRFPGWRPRIGARLGDIPHDGHRPGGTSSDQQSPHHGGKLLGDVENHVFLPGHGLAAAELDEDLTRVESEPFPGDGKNDGIFFIKLDDFMKLYQTVMTVR